MSDTHSQQKGVIPFKIDKNNHQINEAENPVSGAYLRGLPPAVTEEYDLWLRGRGSEDDRIISPEEEGIRIAAGDHFYTAKRVITPGKGE